MTKKKHKIENQSGPTTMVYWSDGLGSITQPTIFLAQHYFQTRCSTVPTITQHHRAFLLRHKTHHTLSFQPQPQFHLPNLKLLSIPLPLKNLFSCFEFEEIELGLGLVQHFNTAYSS